VRLPFTRAGQWPVMRPGRLSAAIRTSSATGARVALLGLPDDLGVRLNQGRPGARFGPAAFRNALGSYGTDYDGLIGEILEVGLFDAGDIEPAPGEDEAALLKTHDRIRAAVLELHQLGLLPVCIGGGHDLSLPALSALAQHDARPLGGINIDAHLDVRQRIGSGMPFRKLIEGAELEPRRFVEYGLGRFANSLSDTRWLASQGASLVYADALAEGDPQLMSWFEVAASAGPAFVSCDLDGLDQTFAPGVSALNPCGLSVRQTAKLVEAAGLHPAIRHFDLMELNPTHDEGGRTARVAAFLFLTFVAGLARRAQP
jgi:formiminoglutamase